MEKETKKEKETCSLPPFWTAETFSDPDLTEKIKLFRAGAAKEYIKDDEDILIARWLVARNWKVDDATKYCIDVNKWHEKENVSNIKETIKKYNSYKFLLEYWPISILPEKNKYKFRTIDGYQLIYEKLCHMSPHLLQKVPLEEVKLFHLYLQELAKEERQKILYEEKDGTSYAGIVFIQDLGGLSMAHITHANLNMLTEFEIIDRNYPETLRRVFFINAPVFFTTVWKLIKKFLDPATVEKIVILGTDYQDELLRNVAPESLLKEYGGELDYVIPGGGSLSEFKTHIPKLIKQNVSSIFSITVEVKEKGCEIGWQFCTKQYDIAFGLLFQKTKDGKKKTIQEVKRENSHKQPIVGIAQADKTGFYTLQWDNTYSWSRGKYLKYTIWIDGIVLKEEDIIAKINT